MVKENKTTAKVGKIEKNAQAGSLGQYFGKEWGVNFTPALGIYKVKVHFFRLNSNEIEAKDIYVEADVFDLFCQDILAFRIARKVEMDRGKEGFPVSYQYITGEKGTKVFQLSPAKVGGVLLQGTIDKKNWAKLPVMYDDLRLVAEKYMAVAKADGWKERIALETLKAANAYREKGDGDTEYTAPPSEESAPTSDTYVLEGSANGMAELKGVEGGKKTVVTDIDGNNTILVFLREAIEGLSKEKRGALNEFASGKLTSLKVKAGTLKGVQVAYFVDLA